MTPDASAREGMIPVDLGAALNGTIAQWYEQVLAQHKIAIDGVRALKDGPITVSGVPFVIASGEKNLAMLPQSQPSDERVEFLGYPVDRRYLEPESRHDTLSVEVAVRVRRGAPRPHRAAHRRSRGGVMRLAWIAAAAALLAPSIAIAEAVAFDPVEIRLVLRHGPWPQPVLRDPSNRASGNAAAIALGARLFFDARLSANGTVACATCHVPARAWTDGRAQARGLGELDRNTPTVLDAGLGRWFGWDGASDSLWSFAVKPILHPAEMGASAQRVAEVVRGDGAYSFLYDAAFRAPPPSGDERGAASRQAPLEAFGILDHRLVIEHRLGLSFAGAARM